MPINVSEAIDSDTAEIITVERTSGGEYVDGLFVKGDVSTFKALASGQPASPDEIQIQPEGERDKNIFKFIANKPIFTTKDREGEEADIIIFKKIRWRVISSADWTSYGHNIVFAAAE